MARILTTHEADDDLVEAAEFIARDSLTAAERFVDQVAARYSRLAEAPGLGRPREDLGPGIRSYPFKTYLIFYREVQGGIEVVRFLSGYRDIEALFD
jgi:toxin ParE1/3/4